MLVLVFASILCFVGFVACVFVCYCGVVILLFYLCVFLVSFSLLVFDCCLVVLVVSVLPVLLGVCLLISCFVWFVVV